ncbi:Acetyltransferase GNAT domain-containing protein [Cladophialophora immunda]|nr:Acetyltransferase GNAT domain-containing protein [Cladophialophora immunda]
MRINEHTCVSTTKVVLVPYSTHHVPKYHGWMKDPDIQEATASEPLTLEEEYAMQRSWRDDADKLTFIICRPHHRDGVGRREQQSHAQAEEGKDPLDRQYQCEIDAMIGDVNLFISTADDDSGHGGEILVGELELMIAEAAHQRQGYGRAALLAFLKYIVHYESEILAEFQQAAGDNHDAQHHRGPVAAAPTLDSDRHRFDHLSVKIGRTNSRSMALFESLAFRKTREAPSYFGEYELRLSRAGLGDLIVHVEADDPAAARRGLLTGYCEAGYACC